MPCPWLVWWWSSPWVCIDLHLDLDKNFSFEQSSIPAMEPSKDIRSPEHTHTMDTGSHDTLGQQAAEAALKELEAVMANPEDPASSSKSKTEEGTDHSWSEVTSNLGKLHSRIEKFKSTSLSEITSSEAFWAEEKAIWCDIERSYRQLFRTECGQTYRTHNRRKVRDIRQQITLFEIISRNLRQCDQAVPEENTVTEPSKWLTRSEWSELFYINLQTAWPTRFSSRYTEVKVLAVYFAADDIGVADEIHSFCRVLRDTYRFTTTEYDIPSQEPARALQRVVDDFLGCDDPEHVLHIFYYGGHGGRGYRNELLWTA